MQGQQQAMARDIDQELVGTQESCTQLGVLDVSQEEMGGEDIAVQVENTGA